MPIQSPAWNDFLSCPVCCLQFDGNTRPPISLGCGHTLCAICLNKLHKNHCPFDQTEMNVKFSDLPVNRAILSLMNDGRRGDEQQQHLAAQCYGPPPPSSSSSSNSTSHNNCYRNLPVPPCVLPQYTKLYLTAADCVCKLAQFLKPYSASGGAGGSNNNVNSSSNSNNSSGGGGALSRSMQRKLVTLINCQLLENEGRARAIRAARSLGERTVTELILHHQNHHQLSANLWAAVRSRGCQFLGPAMQEEVIRLVLLALEDGSALSRKVLVMFVVQRLEPHFPQASKTSIGHVVQLLYRASCFKVSKRERDSSLMQLKEEFRSYDSLRREHDTQIVQIATEAGLRIAPDQWSSLLYGDMAHKSHMQSIMDKLQTPQSFGQSVHELLFALHRTGDPGQLSDLWPQLNVLSALDPGGGNCAISGAAAMNGAAGNSGYNTTMLEYPDEDTNSSVCSSSNNISGSAAACVVATSPASIGEGIGHNSSKSNNNCSNSSSNIGVDCDTAEECNSSWQKCAAAMEAVHAVLAGLVHFLQHYSHRRLQDHHHHHHHNNHHNYHQQQYHGGSAAVKPKAPPNTAANTAVKPSPSTSSAAPQKPGHAELCKSSEHAVIHENSENKPKQHQQQKNSESFNDSCGSSHQDDTIAKGSPLNASSEVEKSSLENSSENGAQEVHQQGHKYLNVSNSKPFINRNNSLRQPSQESVPEIHPNLIEELGACKLSLTPTKNYDAPKVNEMKLKAQLTPYLSIPATPPNLVHVPPATSQSPFVQPSGTLFTAPSIAPEYGATYRPYIQSPGAFAAAPNVPPETAIYPQAPTPIIAAEIYPGNVVAPQAVIVNPIAGMNHHVSVAPPHMYNMIPHNMEFICSVEKGRGQMQAPPPPQQQMLQPIQPMPAMPQQLLQQTAILRPWYEFPPTILPSSVMSQTMLPLTPGSTTDNKILPHTSTTTVTSLGPMPSAKVVSKKSLVELQERKKLIIGRLETIVGKEETDEVEDHIANNQEHLPCVIPRIISKESTISSPAFTSTYSIWTSGANFYSVPRPCVSKDKTNSQADTKTDFGITMTGNNQDSNHEQGGTEVVGNKFGPISKQPRPSTNVRPIQVSASNNVNSTTTSTFGANYSQLTFSPSHKNAVLYPGVASIKNMGSYHGYNVNIYTPNNQETPVSTTTLNTIHHGIIDPPHLRMSLLDPSGCRPSDPIDKNIRQPTGSKEERQRQQFNAVTDGMDPFNLRKNVPEEQRLKQELSYIMHNIQEKLSVQEQRQQQQQQQQELQQQQQNSYNEQESGDARQQQQWHRDSDRHSAMDKCH